MELTPPVHVVAAVIEREGRFLVALRPVHKRQGGLWESLAVSSNTAKISLRLRAQSCRSHHRNQREDC
jgi:hypothetical protein